MTLPLLTIKMSSRLWTSHVEAGHLELVAVFFVNIDQWTKMICKCIQSKPVSHLCPYQDMSGTNSTRKIRFCSTTGEQRVSNFQRFGVILSRFFDLPLHVELLCASWRCSCPCTQVESVTGGLGPGSLLSVVTKTSGVDTFV